MALSAGVVLLAVTALFAGDFLDPFRAEEAKLLKKHRSVRRDNHELVISAKDSRVVLADNAVEGESHVRFALTAAFRIAPDRTDYLVRGFGWESHSFNLINGKSGAKVQTWGLPLLSPDKSHYVAATMDLDAGYETNSLAIYRVTDFELVFSIVWDAIPGEPPTGPDAVSWKSATEVQFTEVSLQPKQALSKKIREIKLVDGKWIGPPNLANKAPW